jgi:hypothetical protein
MPHNGSAIRSATRGGTGCWPPEQKRALAELLAKSASDNATIRSLILASEI